MRFSYRGSFIRLISFGIFRSNSIALPHNLLSPENLALLNLIRTKRPASVHALALLAGRAESNLSRTLKKLQEAGIIELAKGAGKTRIPRLLAQRVTLDLDLLGSGSVVSVQKPEAPRKVL